MIVLMVMNDSALNDTGDLIIISQSRLSLVLSFLPWTIMFVSSPSSEDADPASVTIILEFVGWRRLCC